MIAKTLPNQFQLSAGLSRQPQYSQDCQSSQSNKMHLLSSRDELRIMQGRITQCFRTSDHIILQGYFIRAYSRLYLAPYRAVGNKYVKKLDVNDHDFSPSTIRKMMLEALILLEQLHFLGITVKQPLLNFIYFLQGQHAKKPKPTFLKLRCKQMAPESESMFKIGQQAGIDYLSGQQVQLLRDFYRILSKLCKNKQQNQDQEILQVIDCLTKSQQENKKVYLQQLKSMLTTIYIQNRSYVLSFFLNLHSEQLTFYITNNQTLRKARRCRTSWVKVQNCEGSRSTKEVFYGLASRDIKLVSDYLLSYKEYQTDFYLLIDLSKEQQDITGQTGQKEIHRLERPSQMLRYHEQQLQHLQNSSEDISKQIQYPWNCITHIYLSFAQPNTKSHTRGIGVLISPNIIITAAHYLPLYAASEQRLIGQFMVHSSLFPQKLIKASPVNHNGSDYAVLVLQRPIYLPNYIRIANSLQLYDKVSLVKVKEDKDTSILIHKSRYKSIEFSYHSLTAKPGTEGSPVLVKFQKDDNIYMVGFSRRSTNNMESVCDHITPLKSEQPLHSLQLKKDLQQSHRLESCVLQYPQLIRKFFPGIEKDESVTTDCEIMQCQQDLHQVQPCLEVIAQPCALDQLLHKFQTTNDTDIWLDWATLYKLIHHQSYAVSQVLFYRKRLRVNRLLSFLDQSSHHLSQNYKQQLRHLQLLYLSLNKYQFLLEQDKPHLKLKHDQQLMSPFLSFQTKAQIKYLNLFQFKLTISLEDQEKLKQTVRQIIKFIHPQTPFHYPKAIVDESKGTFRLSLKFITQSPTTLTDFISKAILNKQDREIAKTLEHITGWIDDLHKQGYSLCTPIEYCVFINEQTYSPCFYFFGNYSTLSAKVKMLEHAKDRDLYEKSKEYYPFDEIAISGGDKQALKQIDVWMLGKTFHRIFKRSNWLNYNQTLIKHPLKTIVQGMICPPVERMMLKDIKQVFKKIIPNPA